MGVITGVVWLAQSLQHAEVLIQYRRGLQLFTQISVLILPSLLAVILPFTFFIALVYALQRMHGDSEVAVMFAAGVSYLRLAAPIAVLAALAAAATLWINLDVMPRSYRTFKSLVTGARADIASAVLRGGEFNSVGGRYTVYVEKTESGGTLRGLVISDFGNRGRRSLYLAQVGYMTANPKGDPVLVLRNGQIQRSAGDGSVETVNFETTAVNLNAYQDKNQKLQLELTERYLPELFHPDPNNPWDVANARALIAEGHSRLAAPLYIFAYVFVALYAIAGGAYTRRGYGPRVVGACVIAGGLRVAGIILQDLAGSKLPYAAIYAPPVVAAIVFAGLASGAVKYRRRPEFSPGFSVS